MDVDPALQSCVGNALVSACRAGRLPSGNPFHAAQPGGPRQRHLPRGGPLSPHAIMKGETNMAVKTSARVHEFRLILADVMELTPELADALYQVFDDGTAGSCAGEVTIDFHRQAPSFQQAVQSAIEDVRKAGLELARVESEESRLVEQINAAL